MSSCAWFQPAPKPVAKPVAHAKPKSSKPVEADVFVENLSLARLVLASPSPAADELPDSLSTLRSYDAQKKLPKPLRQQQLLLVELEFTGKNGYASLHILAPAAIQRGGDMKDTLPLLQAVMDKLGTMPVTLQNIGLLTATVSPDNSFVIPDDLTQLPSVLEQQQAWIMQRAQKLPPLDDIRRQMALLDFFMRQHYQDAAYLTLDNTQRQLASATQAHTIDDDAVTALSARLEAQEIRLKQEMPYQF